MHAPDRISFTPDEDAQLHGMRQRAFVGRAADVAERIRGLATELQLDEIVVNTWAHDPEVRRRSYALLAREFGLG